MVTLVGVPGIVKTRTAQELATYAGLRGCQVLWGRCYEDLVSQEVDKYEYRWLRDEQCGDLECAVVERYPRYENSGYTRQIIWWDKEEYRVQKIEYYDRKDALLKTLTYHDYKEYAGEYWRPDRMAMVNHQNGKSTDLLFEEWTFGAGASENQFTASRLRRTR